MTEENRIYITRLKVTDVPWHRLTTAYGRERIFLHTWQRWTDGGFSVRQRVPLRAHHQHGAPEYLWHATPFGMVFLSRILEKALAEKRAEPRSPFPGRETAGLLLLYPPVLHDGDEMEHADPLPLFFDLLKEEYLWSEEYDEEEDEMRYEEDEVFPDDLFYSFYYYSWQAVNAYQDVLESKSRQSLPLNYC